MHKDRLLWLLLVIIFAIVAPFIDFIESSLNNETPSDLQKSLAENNVAVAYANMPPMRSELFPVQDRENGMMWRIATIGNDEVFFTSFNSEDEAQDRYAGSIDNCPRNSLFLCGRDIAYYRGDNLDTIHVLREAARSFPAA